MFVPQERFHILADDHTTRLAFETLPTLFSRMTRRVSLGNIASHPLAKMHRASSTEAPRITRATETSWPASGARSV
jgi:hypothetical protein